MTAVLNAFKTEGVRRFLFNRHFYKTLGMLHDDVIHETPVVKEAIRRLPQKVQDERVFRIIRAMQLSLQHAVLPKEEWTKFEDDVRYLRPYITEVEKEIEERKLLKKNPLAPIFKVEQ